MTNREEHWERTARSIVEEKKIAERRKMFKRAKAFQPVNAPTKADQLAAKILVLECACKLAIDMFTANDCNVPNTIETILSAIEATPERCWVELQGNAE